jgi:1,4-alpha-glucan branching enzyme
MVTSTPTHWMTDRDAKRNSPDSPISIYEVDLASWKRVPEEGNRPLTYREIAGQLAGYVHDAGFTHLQFLPVTAGRLGTPADFMFLVDYLHQRGIGVILDSSPANYPSDAQGFGFKWNTNWMRDTLDYMRQDPASRSYHHDKLVRGLQYAFAENFILPFSHEEVVHGKGSMIGRMPGDEWQKFANLRLLYGFMFGYPGKKLLFMGGEFGQWSEWNPDASLDWHLLQYPLHSGLLRWVRDLNTAYRGNPSLFQLDAGSDGFEWVDYSDSGRSVICFLRKDRNPGDVTLFACNFTPVPRHNYRVGVPLDCHWREILNSDAPLYGGSGQGNIGGVTASPLPIHGRPHSLNLTLPPLGVVVFRPEAYL